jgi:hypothetical protein
MSPWAQDTERILSRPLRVRWGGWETTTTQLQQDGWELAVQEDIRSMTMRMTMRHQGFCMYGISRVLRHFDYFRYVRAVRDLQDIVIEIAHMGSSLVVNLIETNMDDWKIIDAMPQFTRQQVKRIEDFGFFATPLARTNELIVDPARIGEILEQIRQVQLPEQEAIRKRNHLRESREGLPFDAIPKQHFHAQILSIAA